MVEYGSLGCLGLPTAAVRYSPQQHADISRFYFLSSIRNFPFVLSLLLLPLSLPRNAIYSFLYCICMYFQIFWTSLKILTWETKNNETKRKTLSHLKIAIRELWSCYVLYFGRWLALQDGSGSLLPLDGKLNFFWTTGKTNTEFSADLPISCHQAACPVLRLSPRPRVTLSQLEAVYRLPLFRWTFLLPNFSGSFHS